MNKLTTLLRTQLVRLGSRVKPDARIWLFSSTDNRHFTYNSRYLFLYVRENLPGIRPLFVINDPELRETLSREYGRDYFIETESAAGIRKALSAGVWFTSAGLPVYGVHLNRNRLIVNLWHGVPLKKIALLDPNVGALSRLYFRWIFSDNYTYILTTSDKLVPVMRRSFGVPEEVIKVWGQPRNDELLASAGGCAQDTDDAPAEGHELTRETLTKLYGESLPPYKKAILYAPTFRDGGQTRLFPFADYDKEALEDFLSENQLLLFIRTHINEKEIASPFLSERVRFLGNEQVEDITGRLYLFDLLVTDYSSIYIDYLLLDRPEIFLPYDREAYLADRGMNFPYDKVTPGPKPETMEDFGRAITESLYGEDPYHKERRRVGRFFNQVTEPCCGRICREILRETGAEDLFGAETGRDEDHA